MVDRERFDGLVREALAGLRDQSPLLGHPLADLLGAGPPDRKDGLRLHRILLEAIQELRPLKHAPRGSPAWRSYRCLYLRYAQGADLSSIAVELGVSERQVRRDHQEGLRRLADYLWARHCRQFGHDAVEEATELGGEGLDREADLGIQLIRVGTSSTESPSNLGEVLEGALATVVGLARDSGVILDVSVAQGQHRVAMSRVALRQIFISLLSLAIDLASDGRIGLSVRPALQVVRVSLTVPLGGHRPTFAIHEDARFRVSQRLVEMQGGTLDLTWGSEEDEAMAGPTTLTIDLSLKVAELDLVLLVDDDPDVYRLFQRYLKASPYRLAHSLTSRRAIELARQARPHSIILDVIMPTRDGWEILQELRRHPSTRDIPVIICSVLEERGLARSLGAMEFVLKPVTRESLLAALDRCRAGADGGGHRDRPSSRPGAHWPEDRRLESG